MTIYTISYDLMKPGQNYERVQEAIESCGDSIKPMASFWLLDSPLSAQTISDRIRNAHDRNDRHMVAEITRNHQGWLPESAWDWLSQRNHKLAA